MLKYPFGVLRGNGPKDVEANAREKNFQVTGTKQCSQVELLRK